MTRWFIDPARVRPQFRELYDLLARALIGYRRKRQAYREFRQSAHGAVILLDLARFCCANAPAETERQIGRRDVWLRFKRFTEMDEEELTVLLVNLTPEQRHQIYRPGPGTFVEED